MQLWGQAVIKNADMAEDMQQDAIDCATQALEKRRGVGEKKRTWKCCDFWGKPGKIWDCSMDFFGLFVGNCWISADLSR